MSEFEIASLIVGVATAVGVSYTIFQGINRDKQHKRQESSDLLLKIENRLFEINTRWQKSDKSLFDAIKIAKSYVRTLNMLCYLYENNRIDIVNLNYFKRDLKIGKNFKQFLREYDSQAFEDFDFFSKFVDNSKNDIDFADWKIFDPIFNKFRTDFKNKNRE